MKKQSIAILVAYASLVSMEGHAKTPFTLTSADFVPGQPVAQKHMLNGFGCTGGNQSPQLSWHGAPKGTKSFVLTMYDPDAPTGSGWWHWVVYNIQAQETDLPAGVGQGAVLPAGAIEAHNDGGEAHYGGPCPPQGASAHRYILTVHALDVDKLGVPENASPAMIGFMAGMHQLGKATLKVKVKR